MQCPWRGISLYFVLFCDLCVTLESRRNTKDLERQLAKGRICFLLITHSDWQQHTDAHHDRR